jgi:hypothetical protein
MSLSHDAPAVVVPGPQVTAFSVQSPARFQQPEAAASALATVNTAST